MKFINFPFDYSNEYFIPPEVLEFAIKKLFTDEKYKELLNEVKQKIEAYKSKKVYQVTNYLKCINLFVKNIENTCLTGSSMLKSRNKDLEIINVINKSVDISNPTQYMKKRKSNNVDQ